MAACQSGTSALHLSLVEAGVKPGDVVAVKEKSRSSEKFKALAESLDTRIIPKWLDMNKETLSAKVISLASRDEIDYEVDEQLIVELYSK